MNRKKIALLIAFFLLAACVTAYIFRPMTMNDLAGQPHFSGEVTQVSETAILVAVNPEDDVHQSSALIWASLDTQLKDSMTHFLVGDTVKVYYDGLLQDTSPATAPDVYAILLSERP